MDRDTVNKGLRLCSNGEPCFMEKYVSCPFSPRNNAEPNCAATMARACLVLLREQDEIVRCKDCRYGEKTKNGCGEDAIECQNSDLDMMVHDPYWYCGDGERK